MGRNDRDAGKGRSHRYAFGEHEAAVNRLSAVAAVFQEPIRTMLRAVDFGPINLAVDLGCGPGHTTRLLAEVVQPTHLVGLDSSAFFLKKARALGSASITWYCHDVTAVPFPTGPADLLFCRWVLAHLPSPEEVLSRWLGQLNEGGHLLIHEDEMIKAEHEVLTVYDHMSSSLVANNGGDLTVGRRLKDLAAPPGYRQTLNRVYSHVLAGNTAARIFAMNLGVWRHDPWVVETYGPTVLDTMAAALSELAESDGGGGTVTFASRQIVYRRENDGAPMS